MNRCNRLKYNEYYYPYGMTMPGRNGSIGSKYRYAFNGMETDQEVSGSGNSYTTQFRQYDPRLGRWKSLDPLAAQFPWQSPFNGMDDNPIALTDPLGLSTQEGDDPKVKGSGTKDDPYRGDFKLSDVKYIDPENGKKVYFTQGGTIYKAEYKSNTGWGVSYKQAGSDQEWIKSNKSYEYVGGKKAGIAGSRNTDSNDNSNSDLSGYYEETVSTSKYKDNTIQKGSVETGLISETGSYSSANNLFNADGSFKYFTAGADAEFGPGLSDIELDASLMELDANIEIGNPEIISAHGSGNTKIFALEGDLESAVLYGQNDQYGLKGAFGGGMYTWKGDLSGGFTVLGTKVTWTAGASVASAHGGISYELYYDANTGMLVIGELAHVGMGVGVKEGVRVEIPVREYFFEGASAINGVILIFTQD